MYFFRRIAQRLVPIFAVLGIVFTDSMPARCMFAVLILAAMVLSTGGALFRTLVGSATRPNSNGSEGQRLPRLATVLLTDDDRVHVWSKEASLLLGWPSGDALSKNFAALLAVPERQAKLKTCLKELRAAASKGRGSANAEAWLVTQDGTQLTVLITLTQIESGIAIVAIQSFEANDRSGNATFGNDRLDSAPAQHSLRDIADHVPILIAYIDDNERLRYCNETFRRWIQVDPDHAQGRYFREVIGEKRYSDSDAYIRRALSGERVVFEIDALAEIGRYLRNEFVPDMRADGSIAGLYALTSDVTEMKGNELRLARLSRIDALTGLPNRRASEERLAEAIARVQRTGRAMALMFLDIDHFKAVNDTHGHAMGDEVLRQFAQRLRAAVRTADAVFRLAGDEFIVVLEDLAASTEPLEVADNILAHMETPLLVEMKATSISTSIGLVSYDGGAMSAASLMEVADRALYRAKAAGRSRVEVGTYGI